MSLVHWELFILCAALNPNHNSQHQLPYQNELQGQKPTITKLQEIVSKGNALFHTVLFFKIFMFWHTEKLFKKPVDARTRVIIFNDFHFRYNQSQGNSML